MQKYSDKDYKKILARLLKTSMEDTAPAKTIIEQMFNDDDFKEQAINLCDTYLQPEHTDSKLIVKPVDIKALSCLMSVCKREKLGIIPLDFSGDENKVYKDGDKISVLVLSSQTEAFEQALMEACALSGTSPEMPKKCLDTFGKNLQKDNPVLTIHGIEGPVYDSMKRQVKELPYALRFTFFPETGPDGKLNVSFFSKTQPVLVKRDSRTELEGPYNIPKIASVMLACALLDDPSYEEEYEEKKKENRKALQDLTQAYYDFDDAFYIVPSTLTKDGLLNISMDEAQLIDYYSASCPSFDEFKDLVTQSLGMNHQYVLMTEKEYEQFKDDMVVDIRDLSFYADKNRPVYMEPENMENVETKEEFIDTLNRKREQILLASDDFNGQNLTNLENYLTASVSEIILREDNDYSAYIKKEEAIDAAERNVLSIINKKYTIEYAYEDHDPVTELINKEREPVISVSRDEKEDRGYSYEEEDDLSLEDPYEERSLF